MAGPGFLQVYECYFPFCSIEKATSQLLLEPDWDSILQICDCIRQGDIQYVDFETLLIN